jgi:hypothetical protein
MTDLDGLDPATLRAIADELAAEADAGAEAGVQMREAVAAGELPRRQGGGTRLYASGYASGYLVSFLASKALQLRDRALRIEMARRDGS